MQIGRPVAGLAGHGKFVVEVCRCGIGNSGN